VDIDLNPKVGPMWMRRGEQAAVETPGTYEKRHRGCRSTGGPGG
jgi:hypothetical protein